MVSWQARPLDYQGKAVIINNKENEIWGKKNKTKSGIDGK